MAIIGKPIMNRWGNSGARTPISHNMLENEPLGDINPDTLNTTTEASLVEFNTFEETINSFEVKIYSYSQGNNI